MNIFEAILSPFVFVIKQFFLFGYHITGNYGWAIILLSFFISLLLLPVFIYIEREKKKTDAVKRKMKAVEDEIKRVYKGQERYYYLRTLHRQHGYSQFKAMIPILSLLLQIPFFIAAYQFLENYQPLQGVAFGIIKDLSKPDHILGAINLLPIAMTVVNLLTAWFYTRFGDKSERKQMVVIALVFLVLLYNLPSGLVLYWTMNNVFSFFRLFVTNPEVFKKRSDKNLLQIAKENTKRFFVNNRSALILSLLFFVFYFYFAGTFHYNGPKRGIINISALLLFPLEIITLIHILVKGKNVFPTKYLQYFLLLILLLVLQITIFVLSEKKTETIIAGINIFSYPAAVFTGFLFLLATLPFYFKLWNIHLIKIDKGYNLIFILSVFYIAGLVFFWNPIIVFSSFPQDFNFPAAAFFYHNITPFLIVFITSILVYFLTPLKYRSAIMIFFLSTVVIIFAYGSLIPFDVGTLQGNFYSEENNLDVDMSALILDFIFLLSILLSVVWLVKNDKRKLIFYSLILLNIGIISQSLYKGIKSDCFFVNKETAAKTGNDKMAKIHFSKTKPNILIFFPDGAQGWYMNNLINEEPEIREKYDGFTWYPNCVSISNYTYASTPAMLCGKDYTIEELNKDKKYSIAEKYTKAVKCFVHRIDSEGYYLTTTRFKYSNLQPDFYDNYIPIWDDKWSKLLGMTGHSEFWYTRLWENALFNSMPLFIKPKIYNNRNWIISNNVDMNSSELFRYNFLRVLPLISDTVSSDSNFIFLHSMSTHGPFDLITKDGKFKRDVHPYDNFKWTMNVFEKYLEWMKSVGVYDNTKIIIVSDHGPLWWNMNPMYKITNFPVKNFDKDKITMLRYARLNPILMVKDFNSHGNLKYDWRLMTNEDLMNIAFDKNNPVKGDSVSRTVKSFYTQWHKDLHSRSTYSIIASYEIKDNVFDLNNWTLTGGKIAKSYYKLLKMTKKDRLIIRMKEDKEWYEKIKEKARKNHRTVEEQLDRDAQWILKQEKTKKRK